MVSFLWFKIIEDCSLAGLSTYLLPHLVATF